MGLAGCATLALALRAHRPRAPWSVGHLFAGAGGVTRGGILRRNQHMAIKQQQFGIVSTIEKLRQRFHQLGHPPTPRRR